MPRCMACPSARCATQYCGHCPAVTLLCPAPQLIQAMLANMYTTAAATRSFVYATARAADAGRASRKDCAAVILYAAEGATRMALDAIQILGGNGCAAPAVPTVCGGHALLVLSQQEAMLFPRRLWQGFVPCLAG